MRKTDEIQLATIISYDDDNDDDDGHLYSTWCLLKDTYMN